MANSNKNKYVTLFLAVFLGFLGVHKFYLGKKGMGFLYLFTLGLFGIGWIYDIYKIITTEFIVATQQKNFSQPLKAETGVSHTRKFKIAGVTFNDRQKNLKLLKDKGGRYDVQLEEYVFDGKPAIKVIVNGLDVGNLHSDDANFVVNNKSRMLGINDFYIGKFKNENNKTIYYANVSILIKNME